MQDPLQYDLPMTHQPSLFDRIMSDAEQPRARHADPETSHHAAAVAASSAGSHRMLAWRTLRRAGVRGLTDFELADITGVAQTSIEVRRHELVEMKLVEKTEMRRPSPSGSPSIVWRAT